MTFDSRTEANIATLTPDTQAKARAFMALATGENNPLPSGWTVKIIQGTRTYDQQEALYAQGRTTPGDRVTNAPAGYSNHNFGLAFDIGIFDSKGNYIDDDYPQPVVSRNYCALAPLGKGVGLFWGGDWASIDDEPHYELRPWPGLTEDDALTKLRGMVDAGVAIA
jgi:peptidoglycan L-alanyl-D-glutamate endopeptidase CwlK